MHHEEALSPLVADLLAELPYDTLAVKYGPEALPELRSLIDDESEPGLAAKAAYLTGLLGDEALPVLELAARSPIEVVRIAVASVLARSGNELRAVVADALLTDESETVRLSARRALTDG